MTKIVLACSTVVALTACAGLRAPDVRTGSTEAELVRTVGQPTGRYNLPDGRQRLEFSRGPYGRQTYMADLDAQGRVERFEQVLDPRHFAMVVPGESSEEVLRTIGRPSDRMGMMRSGQIWSWRYANNDCLWYQAQLDAKGVVTAAGYGIAPGCDGDDRSGVVR